jgi:hypothetical protein
VPKEQPSDGCWAPVAPRALRHKTALKAGDVLKFVVSGGATTILSQTARTDEERAAKQRRVIDAQLDEAEKGPSTAHFDAPHEMIAPISDEPTERDNLGRGLWNSDRTAENR